jgi:hypothetical protein
VIPITPSGLGIIEASTTALLVSFELTKNIAALSVIGWRLLNLRLAAPSPTCHSMSLVAPGYGPGGEPWLT